MVKRLKICHLFLLLAGMTGHGAWAYGATGPPFFQDATPPDSFPTQPFAKRTRFVHFNVNSQDLPGPDTTGPSAHRYLRMNLFNDVDLTLALEHTEQRPKGRMVYSGHFLEVPGSMGVLTHDHGNLTGIFFVPGKGTFRISPLGKGLHRVIEVDEDKGIVCGVDGSHPELVDTKLAADIPQEGMPWMVPNNYPAGCAFGSVPTVVNLAVIYTPSSLKVIGTAQDMAALIDTVVFYNNMAYFNSGINVQLQLVYEGEVPYTEQGSLATDLNNMANGVVPGIIGIQANYGAALVNMLAAGSDQVAGLAQLPGHFSIEHVSFAECMMHEIGHNFGCGHDTANGGPGLYPYSSGYRYTAGGVLYRTIMAYAPGTYTPFFSSPSVSYLGTTIGVPGAEDNARTINQIAQIVANSYPPPSGFDVPTVNMTAPFNGSNYTGPLTLALSADANDPAGIAQVDFFVDSQFLGSTTTAPYTLQWPLVPAGSHYVTAHAINSQGTGAYSCAVSLFVNPTLPTPWQDQDIGWLMQNTFSPQELKYMGLLGSGSFASGTYTVNGAGSGIALDISGVEEDSFQFDNQPSCSDSTLTARLVSLQNGGSGNQAGLMFRLDPSNDAPYVFMGSVSNGTKLVFRVRTTQGGLSHDTPGTLLATPVWLKLQRVGNVFTGFESPDGSTWTPVGNSTLTTLGANPLVGFAVSSSTATALANAAFDNVNLYLSCDPPTPTITNTPTITLSPTNTTSPTITPTPGAPCAGIITAFAGTGTAGFTGDGGPAVSAELNGNMGLAVDPAGDVYIADSGSYRIRKVSPSGIISTIMGNGVCCGGTFGIPASISGSAAQYLSYDCAGDLYMDAYYTYGAGWNSRVEKIDTCGIITSVAGGLSGYSGDGGPATLAQMNYPYNTAEDAQGNIYVADLYNKVVRKINASGIMSTVVTPPLTDPDGVAVDNSGNLYVSDLQGSRSVFKINPAGVAVTLAILTCPDQIAIDYNNNLYIDDECSQKVYKINASGQLTTLAGTGTVGNTGNGGPATSATFGQLRGVAVDSQGNVYVSDHTYNVVRKISSCVSEGPCQVCAITPICFTPPPTNTPTDTSTLTVTGTPTKTATITPTSTSSYTPTITPFGMATSTPTLTPTITWTRTNTITPTNTSTATRTATFTWTLTPTHTWSPTSTLSPTATFPTFTPTWTMVVDDPLPTITPLPTDTSTPVFTLTFTWTDTATVPPTLTFSGTPTDSPTITDTTTATSTATTSYTPTLTWTPTATGSPSPTSTPTVTQTPTWTPSASSTATNTMTYTPTKTSTSTATLTNTLTAISTFTGTPTATSPFSPTNTWSFTPTATSTASFTPTFTGTSSDTPTLTCTPSFTVSPTTTDTPTLSYTPSMTNTWTFTTTPTLSLTATLSPTQTASPKLTATPAPTPLIGKAGLYPNPVTGPTVLILPPFYLGLSNVRVEVYTLAFRKVQDKTYPSLFSGTAVTLSLTDKWGRPMANGIYYVEVTTVNGRSIGKLLILR
jgi:hypothetical protein